MEHKEKQSDLQLKLKAITEKAPEAGGYLEMCIEVLMGYETDEYKKKPNSVANIIPNGQTGLDEDNQELIAAFLKEYENDTKRIAKDLHAIREQLQDYPVINWALAGFFHHFLQDSPSEAAYFFGSKKPYSMPNYKISKVQHDQFLKACGLMEISDGGKGSHGKWVEEKTNELNGGFIIGTNSRESFYLKNLIVKLINKGMSLETIAQACKELNLTFHIHDEPGKS